MMANPGGFTKAVESMASGKPDADLVANNFGVDYPDVKFYSDFDIERIENLPDSMPHRNVDLAVVQADKEGMLDEILVHEEPTDS